MVVNHLFLHGYYLIQELGASAFEFAFFMCLKHEYIQLFCLSHMHVMIIIISERELVAP